MIQLHDAVFRKACRLSMIVSKTPGIIRKAFDAGCFIAARLRAVTESRFFFLKEVLQGRCRNLRDTGSQSPFGTGRSRKPAGIHCKPLQIMIN